MSSRKVVTVVLAADLADAGTLAISYPAGTRKADYLGGVGHKVVFNQYEYSVPNKFTISLGDATFTLTNGSAATIPSGSTGYVQLEMPGPDDLVSDTGRIITQATKLTPLYFDLGNPVVASSNGISASQTVTGAGTAALLNGALADASGNFVDLGVPRNVVAAWTNTAVLTITGVDVHGNAMVEKSASGTSHTGKKAFKKVTSVTTSATITSATIGYGDVLGLPVFIPKVANVLNELQDGAVLGANRNKMYLTGQWVDVSAADSGWTVSPVAGKITRLWTVLDGAISGADTAVTVEINGVAVTMTAITITQSGSAAGDVDVSGVPTAANTVAVGDKIAVKTDGASSTTAIATWVLEITPDYVLNGTFVAGDESAPTATTGDVRGTYDPTAAAAVGVVFGLFVAVPDPTYLGCTQYAG